MDDYTDILTALQGRGIKASHDKATALKLMQYLEDLKGIPPFSETRLVLVYVYRCQDQPEELQKYDGLTFAHKSGADDSAPEYSIGIADSAILRGRDYTLEVFLHEYSHCIRQYVGLHDAAFHLIHEGLVRRYNQATGSALKAI